MKKGFKGIKYTEGTIINIMTNKKLFEQAKLYHSSMFALEMLLVLEKFINEANFTEKQMKVVELYYFDQLTQGEVSNKLGISQQAIDTHLKFIKTKINRVLTKWGKLNNEE